MANRSVRAVLCAVLLAAAIAAVPAPAGAAAGSVADPVDLGAGDIKTVTSSDDGLVATFGFQAWQAALSNDDSETQWLFDLNNDGTPAEACALVKFFGGNLTFEFYNSGTCGPEVAVSGAVTHPTANSMSFDLALQTLRDAGLSGSATQFRYRVNSSANTDKVPDVTTNLITHVLGTGATTNDPVDLGSGDIEKVSFSNDASSVTLGFDTWQSTLTDEDSASTWLFDLNADGTPAEMCVLVKFFGGSLIGEIYNDGTCAPEAVGTVPVTHPAADAMAFTLTLDTLRAAGLSEDATTYGFIVENSSGDAVDDGGDPIQHVGVGFQTATDTQGINVDVLESGLLSINAVEDGLSFGSVAAGLTRSTAVGDIDYINTLFSGNNWTVTVQATSLRSGTNVIGFGNMAFTPGGSVSEVPSGSGALPTPQTTETAFAGTDTTPGTTFSDPVTIATASGEIQGSYRQSGSALELAVPSDTASGSYTGTLQYTITG